MNIADLIEQDAAHIEARFRARLRGAAASADFCDDVAVNATPALLREMARALRGSEAELTRDSRASEAGSQHGEQRFDLGYDLGTLVREYGSVLEVILEVAEERGVPLTHTEARKLTRMLASAIASSASSYSARRDADVTRAQERHVAFLTHELRNPINTVALAFALAKQTGEIAPGPLVATLERSLKRVTALLDSALTQVRVHAGAELALSRWDLKATIQELAADVAAELDAKGLTLRIDAPSPLEIEADRRVLGSALSNLVRNAIKFTRPGGTIQIRARPSGRDAITLEVEDECGGLPPGAREKLFQAFVQGGVDRSGFGLGLAIVKDAVDAHRGDARVRDLPGKGCVFTLELPRGRPWDTAEVPART